MKQVDINKLFEQKLKKVAQPIQLTNPVLESPEQQLNVNNSVPETVKTPVVEKRPEGKLSSQKDIIKGTISDLQTRSVLLTNKVEIVAAYKRDSNSEEALRLARDCQNLIQTLKNDLEKLALI